MTLASLSLNLLHFHILLVHLSRSHSAASALSFAVVLFRLSYSTENAVLMCCCTCRERKGSFSCTSARLILHSETDASPGKQRSCQDTLLALRVTGQGDSRTDIRIWTAVIPPSRCDVRPLLTVTQTVIIQRPDRKSVV